MKVATTIAVALLVAPLSVAEVPQGFEPQIDSNMEIQFGEDSEKYLQSPGDEALKSDCIDQPIIGRFGVMKDVYFWMLVDLDDTAHLRTAIRDFEWVPFPPSTPQPEPNFARIESEESGPVAWSALDSPGRYVSLLWTQPDGKNWSIPQQAEEMMKTAQTGKGSFDVQTFVDVAGLGGAAVGATWFNVTG